MLEEGKCVSGKNKLFIVVNFYSLELMLLFFNHAGQLNYKVIVFLFLHFPLQEVFYIFFQIIK